MKKTIVPFVLVASLLAAAAPAAADNNAFGIAWSLGLPVGNTHEYAPGLSGRGVSMEWRYFRDRTTAFGASAGWNVFNDKDSGTFTSGNLAVTANRWRYVNAVPVYLNAYKYFSEDRRGPRWFAGLNAGTMWVEQRTEIGLYAFQQQNWHLAVAPEVGIQLPWDSFLGYVALRYNVGFRAGDMDTQSWFDLRLGFGLD